MYTTPPQTMTSEDDQSMVESVWGKKTWENFTNNLTMKRRKKTRQLEKLQ